MKVGEIYKVRLSDADKEHPHWYAVVLYLKSNKNVLVIPAHSEGGAGVDRWIESQKKAGYCGEAIGVLLDNSVAAALKPGVTGHRAWWVTGYYQWASHDEVDAGDLIGQLKAQALKELVGSMLERNKQHEKLYGRGLIATDIRLALEAIMEGKS